MRLLTAGSLVRVQQGEPNIPFTSVSGIFLLLFITCSLLLQIIGNVILRGNKCDAISPLIINTLFCIIVIQPFKKYGNALSDSPKIIKSKEFALQIIKVCNCVNHTDKEGILTN